MKKLFIVLAAISLFACKKEANRIGDDEVLHIQELEFINIRIPFDSVYGYNIDTLFVPEILLSDVGHVNVNAYLDKQLFSLSYTIKPGRVIVKSNDTLAKDVFDFKINILR